jgi:hypothetical protein
VERCEVLAGGSSTRWSQCTFIEPDGRACEPLDLATATSISSVSAVDPFAYYVVTNSVGRPTIERVPIRGGDAQLVAGPGLDTTVNLITVDSQAIFGRATPISVGRMPLVGDQFSLIVGSETDTHVITALRKNSTHVFSASVGSRTYFQRTLKNGGAREQLIESLALDPDDFEVDGDFVFMLSQSDISRIPVGGGATETVAVWEAREQVADLGAGPSYLALATNQRLARVAKSGGQLVTLSNGFIYRVATLADAIYFFRSITGGGDVCANGSELVRVSQAGGAATVIAQEPAPCVSELTTSASGVFWIGNDGTELRALTP